MQAYTDYFAGKLKDRDYDEAELASGARRAAQGGGLGSHPPFAALTRC